MLNIDEDIEKIILSVHNEQKLGAARLEKIIESKYGIHIPHNIIHRILLKNGKTREEINKKKRRKKWIRYVEKTQFINGSSGLAQYKWKEHMCCT